MGSCLIDYFHLRRNLEGLLGHGVSLSGILRDWAQVWSDEVFPLGSSPLCDVYSSKSSLSSELPLSS